MLFGTNKGSYEQLVGVTEGITAWRGYNPPQGGPNGVPTEWPGKSADGYAAGISPIISLRPDLALLSEGKLDEQIKLFLSLAPASTYVTIWAEANAPAQKVNKSLYIAGVQHFNNLAAQVKCKAKVGQCFENWIVTNESQDLRPWVVDGLSWYGMDGYQEGAQSAEQVFGPAFDDILAVITTSNPHEILICETGTHAPEQWPWLRSAFEWAAGNNIRAFLPFWSEADNYPFPTSQKDIAFLPELARMVAQA